MGSDHRKPVVAFVALAFIAAALVGIDRADAEGGRMLAAVIGTSVRVQGDLLADGSASPDTRTAGHSTSTHGALTFDAGRSAEDDGDTRGGPRKAGKTKDQAKAERIAAKAERIAAKADRMAAKADRMAAHARWLSSKARGRPSWAYQASEHGRSQSTRCAGKSTDRPGRGHKRGGGGFSGRR